MPFKEIKTQEEFDEAVSDRLERERRKYKDYMSPDDVTKKYEGYLSPDEVTKKYEGYLSPDEVTKKYEGYISKEEAAKKDSTIAQYERDSVKMKVARETGIPFELAGRLSGEDEAEIRKDAEALAKLIKPKQPAHNSEPAGSNKGTDKKSALRSMLQELKGE